MTESKRLLPIYREFDSSISALVTKAKLTGYRIPCKRGCDACCYDLANVTQFEIVPIIEHVRTWSHDEREGLKERMLEWIRRIKGVGLNPANPESSIKTFYSAKAACPFLDRNKRVCTIYDIRPLSCRGHYLIDQDPKVCSNRDKKPTIQNLVVDDLVVSTCVKLARSFEDVKGTVAVGIAPLPAMLLKAWVLIKNPKKSVGSWLQEIVENAQNA